MSASFSIECKLQSETLVLAFILTALFQGEVDLDAVNSFGYETFQGELLIGEIFVRIFNKQPTFPIDVSFQFPSTFISVSEFV